jgi:uncharacterized membrane protein
VTERAAALTTHRSRPAGEIATLRAMVHSKNPSGRIVAVLRQTSMALVAAGVLAQIAYPLLVGDSLRVATMLSVLLLSAACILHAGAAWGARGALGVLVVAGGLGLAAETVGVHADFPFGDYAYSDGLGTRLAGVPIIVPLAWTMLAYPCLLLGRRLAQHRIHAGGPFSSGGPAGSGGPSSSDKAGTTSKASDSGEGIAGRRWITALTGGIGLAGWDLFLDPQMVAQGDWSWANPSPALPGVPGVPLTNYAGWLLVSVLMIAALDRALPVGSPAGELAPAIVLTWTWLGSAVGNLLFFDRPWVALYGGLVMGAVTLPYLLDGLGRYGLDRRDGPALRGLELESLGRRE